MHLGQLYNHSLPVRQSQRGGGVGGGCGVGVGGGGV